MFNNHANFIDSLVVYYKSDDIETYNNSAAREFSVHNGNQFQKNMCGWDFEVRIQIKAGYPITMRSDAGLEIRFTKTHPKKNPACEIKLFRPLIWTDPVKQFNEVRDEITKRFGAGKFYVKRIDLCIHSSGFDFVEEHRKLFSGKFKAVNDFTTGNYSRGRFTGFLLGSKKSPLSLKIYNKSLEVILKSSSNPIYYYKELPSSEVWCIEFTYLRKSLRDFGLDDPEDVFNSLPSLWSHATTKFVSLKSEGGDSNLARKDVSPFWEWVSSQWGDGPTLSKIEREPDIDKDILYDRAFSRFYKAARELMEMEFLGDYRIDILELAKGITKKKKTTSKQIKNSAKED